MDIKEVKRNTVNTLKMIYNKVESISTNSILIMCQQDNNRIHLYNENGRIFTDVEILEVKTFKTLVALQLLHEVIILDKYSLECISRHVGYRMTTKRVSQRSSFALLEMFDRSDLTDRIEVYNIKTKKVAGLYDRAKWKDNGHLIIIDKDGREFVY